ncbi:substrate-binding domain-containing protein [Jiangella mangrovi]|uniref:Ribose transport system substrate-binding protein n=1 Tax=Jiangella mangrovi TaxID=1524084 RepID=A0A7W9LL82_9ACTN|nr:substrate-binding domain-containing protein [Jiangella mangrovi]MBB5787874.1 ribose transport system substrate-binding protein [Jiangella mangrovi]
MKASRIGATVVAGLLALGLAGCGGSDDSDDTSGGGGGEETSEGGDYTIGVANFTLGGPYFNGMDTAIRAQAEDRGVEAISTDANGDAAKLASDVEDLISRGVDAVIISGGPLESAPAVLNSLSAAGIPVVLVDRQFQTGEYTSWLGPDNERIGVQDGEFIAEYLPDGGKVGIIKGGPADNSIGLARTEGFTSVIGSNPAFEVVEAPDFGGWGSDGGLTVMENLLASHPDMAAVFCENDAMCLGAQRAIENAGLTDQIVLAGVDGQLEALEAIATGGNYVVTGLNSADEIGRLGLDRALDILDGEDVEKDTVVDSPQITQDNAQEHIDRLNEITSGS